jgi:S-adenosylmethionine/arginine decarboxylase-like enzyme
LGIIVSNAFHLTITSYPDAHYLALDFVTSAQQDPEALLKPFIAELSPSHVEVLELPRGVGDERVM